MSILIPETIKTYCANKENTQAMNALIEAINNKKSNLFSDTFDDYQKKCEVELFVEKFKYDMWKFRYDLWKAVWGEVCKNDYQDLIDGSNTTFCSVDEYDIMFYVSYEIGKTYNFMVSSINGIGSTDGPKIIIGASVEDNEKEESVISEVEIKNKKLELKYEKYDNVEEHYTESEHFVDINKIEKIEDDDIKKFRDAAKQILDYITTENSVVKKVCKCKK